MSIELVYRTSDGTIFSSIVPRRRAMKTDLEACRLLAEEIDRYGLHKEDAQALAIALTEKFTFTPIPEDF
ncbi:hypothetical protein WP1_176 [Pseudomonas phage WP1]